MCRVLKVKKLDEVKNKIGLLEGDKKKEEWRAAVSGYILDAWRPERFSQ